jgi:rubrerythrin
MSIIKNNMKTYICQICGDAYIGAEKPKNCPFCGAREHYIKLGKEADPIVIKEFKIGEVSKVNLKKTYDLETKASAIYTCMAGKAKSYEIKAMYKRLAKVELEHAVIVTKLLKTDPPKVSEETCSDEDVENFKKTIELEENASNLYAQFAKNTEEENIRILFTALMQVEADHIELIKNYL